MSSLDVSGVTKAYSGVMALNDVTLEVGPGLVHGLIGPNGAGKSTLIGILSGFVRPDRGSVQYQGTELTKLSPRAISSLGIVRTFQGAMPLFGMTVLENVLVGMHRKYRVGPLATALRLRKQRSTEAGCRRAAMTLLEACGLADLANSKTEVLTLGNLRLLEVARALAADSRVLLLDEPAAGLNDVELGRLTLVLADCRKRGMGVLLIEHNVGFVLQTADVVTALDFGEVLATGSPQDVYEDSRVRAAYLGIPELTEQAG